MSAKFQLRCVGESRDGRANLWSATCKKCKKMFTPKTTRLAHQEVKCPKCGEEEVVNYNDEN